MELRTAIEKLKNHYINFLLNSGFKDESEEELKKMTFTELKNLCKNFTK